MKVAILGGTGNFGKGISIRLSKVHDVILGSRFKEKAEEMATKYAREARASLSRIDGSLSGTTNEEAVSIARLVVTAINAGALESFLDSSSDFDWGSKLVLSPVTRFEYSKGIFTYRPFQSAGRELSAAQLIKQRLGDPAQVVSGMQLVPASKLADLDSKLGYDVPLCGPKEACAEVSGVLRCIDGLRFLYAGPLSISYSIEATLPLMLNIAVRNSLGEPGLRLV